MTNKELREHGIGSRFAQTATGYKRAVNNAIKQFNATGDGFAELYTKDSLVLAEIGERCINLSIMTRKEEGPVVEAAEFRSRVLALTTHLVSQILREEKRHIKTN